MDFYVSPPAAKAFLIPRQPKSSEMRITISGFASKSSRRGKLAAEPSFVIAARPRSSSVDPIS